MTATLIYRKQEYRVAAGQTVEQALQSIGLIPEQYLAVRAGVTINLQEVLQDGDIVNLVAAISGG